MFEQVDHFQQVVHFGRSFTADLNVANRGGGTLKVEVTASSCGCTMVEPRTLTLAPGESGALKATVDANRLGPISSILTVATNDPWRPVTYLTLRGAPEKGWTVVPERLLLRAPYGELPSRSFVICGPPLLRVLYADCDPWLVDLVLAQREEVPDGLRYHLRATLAGTMPVGDHVATIRVRAGYEDEADILVPVTVRVLSPIVAEPTRVFLGRLHRGDPTVVNLDVTSCRPGPFRIAAVEGGDGALQGTCDSPLPAATHRVRLILDTAKPGTHDTTVTIRSDICPGADVEVPVTWEVSP